MSNFSKEWSRSVLDLGISYREDVDQVIDLLSRLERNWRSEEPYKSAILEPLQVLGVEKFEESQMVIRMMVKTVPLKQWEVGRELRRRIKIRFDEKGIQLPFPHRVPSGETKRKIQITKFQIPNKISITQFFKKLVI